MIKSFRHKGLERFYTSGSTSGIQSKQAKKLRMRLAVLDTAQCIEDIDVPGYRLHQLKGEKKGLWSITVNSNWRIIFEYIEGNAYIVNYEDYH